MTDETGRALFDDPPALDEGRPGSARGLVEWVAIVALAVVCALAIKTFVVQAFYIPSGSMEPTLEGGPGKVSDRVLVNKLSYHLHDVRRGDVIVFSRPVGSSTSTEPGEDDLIKRVIGLPGERIIIRDGHVLVNGGQLDEPWLPSGVTTQIRNQPASYPHLCTDADPCDVPAGSVWAMGDNRTISADSRYLGPIPEDLIIGRAFALVFPFDRLGGL